MCRGLCREWLIYSSYFKNTSIQIFFACFVCWRIFGKLCTFPSQSFFILKKVCALVRIPSLSLLLGFFGTQNVVSLSIWKIYYSANNRLIVKINTESFRQTSVQTSTFGSEFTALKKAVEVAITIRYHLRSMGVKVTKPTKIFVDNKSVCINSSNPASTLNKKAIALAYHFVREHQAAGIVEIHYIKSEDNYADCLTKALNSTKLRTLQHEFMTNWTYRPRNQPNGR